MEMKRFSCYQWNIEGSKLATRKGSHKSPWREGDVLRQIWQIFKM
jgi:hypothetical protein